MAKSKSLVAAESRIAALEARLTLAAQVYRNQVAIINALEAKLATRGVIADRIVVDATHSFEPIVTRFTKADGSVWEKTRVGNRAVLNEVLSN